MKKISILVVTTLLISSCSSTNQVNSPGFVPGCDQVKLLDTADKSIPMQCLDGVGSFNFYQLKGPMVINVWGSWCEGCKVEMPYFVDLYETAPFQSGQVQLLGINVEESSKDDAIEYIKKSGMSWPHLEDLDGISKSIFGPGVPVTWFINEVGENVGTKIGAYTSKKQLFEQVEESFGIKL
jgi:cytochrome c biogenesis protein CcmG/thiol:disulfide interchange protein DsbE